MNYNLLTYDKTNKHFGLKTKTKSKIAAKIKLSVG